MVKRGEPWQRCGGRKHPSTHRARHLPPFETPCLEVNKQAMLSIAHSVGQCRAPPGAASSQRLLPHPPRSGFHRQRPYLRPQTLLAQAVQQTCSDQPQEQPDVCTPAKGLAAVLTTCATALATAFVAVSPAAAILAPADISQLQETLTEVWGKLDP